MVIDSEILEEINDLQGIKYIGKVFDNSGEFWMMLRSSTTSTAYTIYGMAFVEGYGVQIFFEKTITASSMNVSFAVIDDYVLLMYGSSASNVTVKVYNKSGSLIQISPVVGNYVSKCIFAFKNSSGQYFLAGTSNESKETPFLYNISSNTVTRVESTHRIYSQYFSYLSGTSNCAGCIWNQNYKDTMVHAGWTSDSITNTKTLPGNPVIDDAFYTIMFPISGYTNSEADLPYEVYAVEYEPVTSTTSSPTPKTTMTNVITNNSGTKFERGSISIPRACFDYGVFVDSNYSLYSYDESTGNIILQYSPDLDIIDPNKIATHTEARYIGGTGTSNNKDIIRDELSTYSCALKHGREAFYPTYNKNIRWGDIQGTPRNPVIPDDQKIPITVTASFVPLDDMAYNYVLNVEPLGAIPDLTKITTTFWVYATESSISPLLQQQQTGWSPKVWQYTGEHTFASGACGNPQGLKDPADGTTSHDYMYLGVVGISVATGAYDTNIYSGIKVYKPSDKVIVYDRTGGGGSSEQKHQNAVVRIYSDDSSPSGNTWSKSYIQIDRHATSVVFSSNSYDNSYYDYSQPWSTSFGVFNDSTKKYYVRIKDFGLLDLSYEGTQGGCSISSVDMISTGPSSILLQYEYGYPDGFVSDTDPTVSLSTLTSDWTEIPMPTSRYVEFRIFCGWSVVPARGVQAGSWYGKPWLELEFTYQDK